MTRVFLGLLILCLASAVMLGPTWLSRPNLSAYETYYLPPGPEPVPDAEAAASSVTVTWLGVSTLLIDDGETALMTDGFFSRPSLVSGIFGGKIAPDVEAIAAGLERLQPSHLAHLAAVLVVHSHYDHSMDAPEVARRSGAVLMGSESTANVGRGWKLPEEQILVVKAGEPNAFGRFRVTFFESRHVPLPFGIGRIGQAIERPLEPPATPDDYAEGGSYSILIQHPLGSVLIQGSAGWVEGALSDVQADVVLLGVGALDLQDRAYQQRYFDVLVEAVGARKVIPIHFDDLFEPAQNPALAGRRYMGDFDAVMELLIEQTEASSKRSLGILPVWQPVTLF